jgi:glycosyltransferase involved in cell wall biosynthesis
MSVPAALGESVEGTQLPHAAEPAVIGGAVVLIPAFDEAATVATVVGVARAAGIGPVVVIDDGSVDDTGRVAARAGAEVLRLGRNLGKGGAMAAGARSRGERVVVLLDADLTGLTPEHVRRLAEPVLRGEVEMTRGVFVEGRWRTNVAQRLLPVLNGQRAMLRERLLEIERLEDTGYGVEVAISHHAKRSGWRTRDVSLAGVSQVMKEEKRGPWRGLLVRLAMYAEILWHVVLRGLRPPRRSAAGRSVRERPPAAVHRNAPKR